MTDLPTQEIEGLLRGLRQIGLRSYEARVLLALLFADSANSLQLAELSGVPRTSIYRATRSVTERRLAEAVPKLGATVWISPG